MADLAFDCPCGEIEIVVDEKGRGLRVPCPKCGKQILVPGVGPPGAVSSGPASGEIRLAPVRAGSGLEAEAPRALPRAAVIGLGVILAAGVVAGILLALGN